ncbi:MAG: hypothetical protein ACOCVF_04225 [bacterium]
MHQLKLFNTAWYDKNKRIYHVETSRNHYKIYENPDGTIKKTVGLGHGTIARNSFETNNAKILAVMLSQRLSEDYVDPNNLLPVLWKPSQKPISFKYIIKKTDITRYNDFIKNIKKLGFSMKVSSDNETIFISYKNY